MPAGGFDYDFFKLDESKVVEIKQQISAPAAVIVALKAKENLPQVLADSEEKMKELGKLCYKVGTYYCYVKGDPQTALPLLEAAQILVSPKEQWQLDCWIKSHVAFCYQLSIRSVRMGAEEEAYLYESKALENCNQVIGCCDAHNNEDEDENKHEDGAQDKDCIKIGAFAYCVRAATRYEISTTKSVPRYGAEIDKTAIRLGLDEAKQDYDTAIQLYEKNGLCDDYQYAKAKLGLAQVYQKQENYLKADRTFKELAEFWEKHDVNNINYVYFCEIYAAHLECQARRIPQSSYELLKRALRYHQHIVDFYKQPNSRTKFSTIKITQIQEELIEIADQKSCNQLTAGVGTFKLPVPSETREQNEPAVNADRSAVLR